jgi:hypothetical protein
MVHVQLVFQIFETPMSLARVKRFTVHSDVMDCPMMDLISSPGNEFPYAFWVFPVPVLFSVEIQSRYLFMSCILSLNLSGFSFNIQLSIFSCTRAASQRCLSIHSGYQKRGLPIQKLHNHKSNVADTRPAAWHCVSCSCFLGHIIRSKKCS